MERARIDYEAEPCAAPTDDLQSASNKSQMKLSRGDMASLPDDESSGWCCLAWVIGAPFTSPVGI
jgi:hypothetical protein